MKLQERDKEILKSIFQFGCLTSNQIAELFDMHIKICQRRLRVLVESEYLRKISIPTTCGRSPYLFYPGTKAQALFELSASKPRITRQLSHQQANSDLLIYIKKSFQDTNIKCNLLPEHIIRISKKTLIPDGSFKLTRNDKSALFFIENCAGTEIISSPTFNEDIENKIIRYTEFFQTNETSFYKDIFAYQFNRFKLLYITNSAKRLESISPIIKKHDQYGFIYMTTKKSFLKNNIFTPIWSIPATNEISVSFVKE